MWSLLFCHYVVPFILSLCGPFYFVTMWSLLFCHYVVPFILPICGPFYFVTMWSLLFCHFVVAFKLLRINFYLRVLKTIMFNILYKYFLMCDVLVYMGKYKTL